MEPKCYDRYIPFIDRSSIMNFYHPCDHQVGLRNNYTHKEINRQFYNNQLYEICVNSQRPTNGSSIFRFQNANILPIGIFKENAYREEKENERQQLLNRNYNIPNRQYSTLEFPSVPKNDNLDILHISQTGEVAVGINDDVHLFSDFSMKKRVDILTLDEIQTISCVHWMPRSNTIFNGSDNGEICLLDAESGNELTENQYSIGKVSCASSPSQGSSSVYFGTTKGLVEKIDLRKERRDLLCNQESICAIAISPDNLQLALGTSEGELKIFDLRTGQKSLAIRCHRSSINAISWAPWKKDTLFVGGGIADPALKAIHVLEQKIVAEDRLVNCAITAIHSCYEEGKLVACHGNTLSSVQSDLDKVGTSVVWDYSYDSFAPLAELKGKKPVSFSSLNPDRTELLTIDEDEKIRFWKIGKPIEHEPERKPSVFRNSTFRTLR